METGMSRQELDRVMETTPIAPKNPLRATKFAP
jgi:hypothetical protein